MSFKRKVLHFTSLFFLIGSLKYVETQEDDTGVYYPTKCEVCKFLAFELEARLAETGKTHQVLEIGHNSMKEGGKKIKKYAQSELRLIESLSGICEKMLEYNIHKERKDSSRFAKGMSETFQTLHNLVDKGVKVDLGIPYDLWDKSSVEIVTLKTECESLLEEHEEAIEQWYFHKQDVPLKDYLCSQRALKKGDDGCLDEASSRKEKDRQRKRKENLIANSEQKQKESTAKKDEL